MSNDFFSIGNHELEAGPNLKAGDVLQHNGTGERATVKASTNMDGTPNDLMLFITDKDDIDYMVGVNGKQINFEWKKPISEWGYNDQN